MPVSQHGDFSALNLNLRLLLVDNIVEDLDFELLLLKKIPQLFVEVCSDLFQLLVEVVLKLLIGATPLFFAKLKLLYLVSEVLLFKREGVQLCLTTLQPLLQTLKVVFQPRHILFQSSDSLRLTFLLSLPLLKNLVFLLLHLRLDLAD